VRGARSVGVNPTLGLAGMETLLRRSQRQAELLA
jgi:hypothetical protein